MARRARAGRELEWWKPKGRKAGCWRKRYSVNGKQEVVYYPDIGETREESYSHALAMWRQKQAELARDALPAYYMPPPPPPAPTLTPPPPPPFPPPAPPTTQATPANPDDSVLASLRSLLAGPVSPNAHAAYARIRNALAKVDARPAGEVWWKNPVLMQAVTYAVGRASDETGPGAKPPAPRVDSSERDLERLIDAYLAERKLQVELGQIGPKMFAEHRQKLDTFRAYTAAEDVRTVEETGSDLLRDYRLVQLGNANSSKISRATAKKRLDVVARFYRWLLDNGVITSLPVSLQSKEYAQVSLPDPKPAPFTVAEVQSLYKTAPQRTRLYITLALNCGYRQLDISTLTHEYIDWAGGFVRRKRHKTGTPQYSKLWPVTFKLLKAESTAQSQSEFVLLGADGETLVREYLTSKDTLSGRDSIKSAFMAAKKAAGMSDDKRGFASLRDTGATEVEKLDKSLTSHYLAHTDKRMAAAYVERYFEPLFSLTDKLDAVFKLGDVE